MNTETQKENNVIVRIVAVLVDTLARSFVAIFDGLRLAIEHANPSLFALVATLLPFALPLPVAFMTASSARNFFGWEPWAAYTLGFGLEGLGLLAWVKLVDAVLDQIRSNNPKVSNLVWMYAGVALVYEVVLLFVNVVLARQEGAGSNYVLVLSCICLLPALSALVYGHQKQQIDATLARDRAEAAERKERERKEQAERDERIRQEQIQIDEKIRQEKRDDRMALQRLKLGYAAETQGAELEQPNGAKFRKGKVN